MKLLEGKLDSARFYDSFGFGATLAILACLFLSTAAPVPIADMLDWVAKVPNSLSLIAGVTLVFVVHLVGRGVMFVGNTLAQVKQVDRFSKEWSLANIDHPFAQQLLQELKRSSIFADGVLGLGAISTFFLFSLNVRYMTGFISSTFGLGWAEVGIALIISVGAWIWQRKILADMTLAANAYKKDVLQPIVRPNAESAQ